MGYRPGFHVLPRRWVVEIVQSQMTKAGKGAITRCGKDIANLDLAIGHNDAINKQFDQCSPLYEVAWLSPERTWAQKLPTISDRTESDLLAC